MAELPFFPMAIDAYLADTRHLSDAEHGRYHLILYELWRAPKQRLPNDDTWLARRLCRSVERVVEEIRPLLKEFCDCDGNWITQKRLSKEFLRARKVTKQRSDAAKSLWRKKKQASERISEDAQPRIGSADEPTPTLRPTPTPIIKEESERATRSGSRLPEGWQPSAEDRLFAEQLGKDPDAIAPSFRDYWHGVAGAKGRKADWGATWRNWVRRDVAAAAKASPFARKEPAATMIIDDGQWGARMRGWRQSRFWVYTSDWGPDPEQAGCLVPPHLLPREAA